MADFGNMQEKLLEHNSSDSDDESDKKKLQRNKIWKNRLRYLIHKKKKKVSSTTPPVSGATRRRRMNPKSQIYDGPCEETTTKDSTTQTEDSMQQLSDNMSIWKQDNVTQFAKVKVTPKKSSGCCCLS
uniref:Uncharacterized protein n=1 Tax=Pyxicephalus adspersus TaxID=30357 RepID=A0AAV3A3J3_PYXAD|nr:TPA: hypothetical protein GDO54_014653 [Pyxicephalus adspersus]